MNSPKIMIIGLDAGNWKLLNPLIEQGYMPNLQHLRDSGCHGQLTSTEPPVTPAAWTTLMTGVNPGKHGVYGFERLDMQKETLHFTNSQIIRYETMWSYLSRSGFTVASLNVPQTYPPFTVNGTMVSGYCCPGKNFNYTYPPELKDLIAANVPDYDMALHWQKGNLDDDALFGQNMAYCKKAFQAIYDLAKLIEKQYGWDIMLAEIQQTDLLQHHIYGYMTTPVMQKNPTKATMVIDMVKFLDEIIGKLAGMADGEKDIVIVASDHGQCPFKAKVKPNTLLKNWGYLTQSNWLQQLTLKLKKNIKALSGKNKSAKINAKTFADKLLLNTGKTKAYIAHTAQHAFLYINLQGRQPNGIVAQGKEYQQLREELRQRLLAVQNPETGENIFTAVKTPEEMFGVTGAMAMDAGDLVLVANEGYLPIRSLRGNHFIEPAPTKMGGTHSYDGMYLITGSHVKAGIQLDAQIADIAPTIYSVLDVPLPGEIDGRVLTEAFDKELTISQTLTEGSVSKIPANELSSEEEQLINQRLTDLGYLE